MIKPALKHPQNTLRWKNQNSKNIHLQSRELTDWKNNHWCEGNQQLWFVFDMLWKQPWIGYTRFFYFIRKKFISTSSFKFWNWHFYFRNEAVYTAGACSNTNFPTLKMSKNPKIQKSKKCKVRHTDGRTDWPPDRHGDLGSVPATKN